VDKSYLCATGRVPENLESSSLDIKVKQVSGLTPLIHLAPSSKNSMEELSKPSRAIHSSALDIGVARAFLYSPRRVNLEDVLYSPRNMDHMQSIYQDTHLLEGSEKDELESDDDSMIASPRTLPPPAPQSSSHRIILPPPIFTRTSPASPQISLTLPASSAPLLAKEPTPRLTNGSRHTSFYAQIQPQNQPLPVENIPNLPRVIPSEPIRQDLSIRQIFLPLPLDESVTPQVCARDVFNSSTLDDLLHPENEDENVRASESSAPLLVKEPTPRLTNGSRHTSFYAQIRPLPVENIPNLPRVIPSEPIRQGLTPISIRQISLPLPLDESATPQVCARGVLNASTMDDVLHPKNESNEPSAEIEEEGMANVRARKSSIESSQDNDEQAELPLWSKCPITGQLMKVYYDRTEAVYFTNSICKIALSLIS
jgi:hypothetical protein